MRGMATIFALVGRWEAALAHFTGVAIGGYVRKDSWPVIVLQDTVPSLLDAEMPCKWDVMSKPQHSTTTLLR